MFKIFFTSRAEKEFFRLPYSLKQKLYLEFEKLEVAPFTAFDVKKLKGTEFGYRLRIGRWRILLALFFKEKRIEILDIFLKKGREDYRKRKDFLK